MKTLFRLLAPGILLLTACNSGAPGSSPTSTTQASSTQPSTTSVPTSVSETITPANVTAPAVTDTVSDTTSVPTTTTPSATDTTSTTTTLTPASADTTSVPTTTTPSATDTTSVPTTPSATTEVSATTSATSTTSATTPTATITATTTVTTSATPTATATISPTGTVTGANAISATSATAELQAADGTIFGAAQFTETGNGVAISVQISGFITATAGEHGIHIHQIGACTPDFAAAGAHYNPTQHKHGSQNPSGPHAGDLENIVFDSDGNATYSTTHDSFALGNAMTTTSLLAADGSAIVVHANADDYITDPSGKSGDRLLCGVLRASGVETMTMAVGAEPPPGGTLNQPAHRAASPKNITNLKVPEGFTVTVFAQGLDNARMIAEHRNGTIYVTRRNQGDVIGLRDDNGDGKAEPFFVAASGIELVHGIVITGDTIYLGAPKAIYRGTIQAGGLIGNLREFVTGLPEAGQHANTTIGFGPNGNLYAAIGSTCNSCNDSNPENATLLQIAPDGASRKIFASGLRNTIGWGWQPETGELWGMDHGSDWRGDDQPPEELNHIQDGNNYGWPHCYADKQIDKYLATPPLGKTKAEFCADSTGPTLTYQAHSAPIAMVFYTATQFPETYQNGAFIAMRGSWNRAQPTGYKVVFLRFENGQPVEFSDFLTGFLIENNTAMFGRPAGLLVRGDGSLLVTDDTNGVMYQINYARG